MIFWTVVAWSSLIVATGLVVLLVRDFYIRLVHTALPPIDTVAIKLWLWATAATLLAYSAARQAGVL
ncbi:MAG: hypothetical protein DYH12_35785 [Sorangiineae bacterium PRO1]|nr:hypothetical protein [Sorangiineae bacterium PRO1]